MITASKLVSSLDDASSLLDDYKDLIRDNHDAELNKRISDVIVKLSEMQELLNEGINEDQSHIQHSRCCR